jgi:hypothetical protein
MSSRFIATALHHQLIVNGCCSVHLNIRNSAFQTHLLALLHTRLSLPRNTSAYNTGRVGRRVDPASILSLPHVYDTLFTRVVVNALIAQLHGRRPYLFYAAFVSSKPINGVQRVHTDVQLRDAFSPAMLMIDTSGDTATTFAVAGSHTNPSTHTPPARITLTDDTVLFDARIRHHASAVTHPTHKLLLSFLPQAETEHEHHVTKQHFIDFGDVKQPNSPKLKATLVPLKLMF